MLLRLACRALPSIRACAACAGLAALVVLADAPATAQSGAPCQPSPTSLCLQDDRFRVEVEWADFESNPLRPPGRPAAGIGQALLLDGGLNVDEGGYFFFDSAADPELIVRMLDGRNINGHFWVFYGALTNVELTVTVTDTLTDDTERYINPAGELTAVLDTQAFATDQQRSLRAPGPPTEATVLRRVILPSDHLPSCASATVACVHDGRFAIEASVDRAGAPVPVPRLETPTSAILSATAIGGPDVGVKLVDARAFGGEYWLFATSTPLVGLALTVTDLETRRAVTYSAAQPGDPIAVGDTTPFVPDPPGSEWMTTPALPGFRFQVRVTGGGRVIPTRQEADCVPETLCVSAAVRGRSELFLRMVGPKPNGFLQANIVKFSTSEIEVWVEQIESTQINYYLLAPVEPGGSELSGLVDRTAFLPPS